MPATSSDYRRVAFSLSRFLWASCLLGSVQGRALSIARATGLIWSTASNSPAAGSDGGSGPLNYVWAGYAILIAMPLLVAGLRLRSFTSGCGLGLSIALVVWVAVVNSSPPTGFGSSRLASDLVVTAVPMALSFLAILLGFIRGLHYLGHVLLGGVAGTALALHVVLFKQSLLIPIVPVIYGLIGLLAVLGIVGVVLKQRLGVIISTSITGGCLASLAADLIKNGQGGISFGLRAIFDGTGHLSILKPSNYKPDLSTQIILASGLGLALLCGVAQHFFWPGEFLKKRQSTILSDLSDPSTESSIQRFVRRHTRFAPSVSSEEEHMVAKSMREAQPWRRIAFQPAMARAPAPAALVAGPTSGIAERQKNSSRMDAIQAMATPATDRSWRPPFQHPDVHRPSPTAFITSSAIVPSPSPTSVPLDYFDPASPQMRPPTAFRPYSSPTLPPDPSSLSRPPSRLKIPERDHPQDDSARDSRFISPRSASPASIYPPTPTPLLYQPLDSESSLAYAHESPLAQVRGGFYGFPSPSPSDQVPPAPRPRPSYRRGLDLHTGIQEPGLASPAPSDLIRVGRDLDSAGHRPGPRRFLPPSQTRI